MTDTDRDALRELISARIDGLSGMQAHTVAGDPTDEASAPDPTGQVWYAITDVLATERRALAALAPQLSAQTNARIVRDETTEEASYPELTAVADRDPALIECGSLGSAGRAAVDRDRHARNVGGGVGAQKRNDGGGFRGVLSAAERNPACDPLLERDAGV